MGTNFTSESAARIVDVVKQVEANPLGENPPMPSASVIAEAYAKITVETGSGVYEAKEQVFDGTAFIDLTNGRLWDGSPIPKIFESSLVTGIAVDTIVKLTLVGNNSGEATWIFTIGGGSAYNGPWKVGIDTADETAVAVRETTPNGSDRVTLGNNTGSYGAKDSESLTTENNDCYVYVEFNDINGASLKVSNAFPNSIDGTMRWVLAFATWSIPDQKVTGVEQWQFGQIIMPSRVADL